MVQCVKDSGLSLQQLELLLWHKFDPWAWELPYATLGMAKKILKRMKDSVPQ